MSRLLPGAPWPYSGSRGFRCAAAGGEASLLRSRRRFSLAKLQVGPASSPSAARPRLHPGGPAAGCWDPDRSPRPSAGSQEPAGGHRQGRSMPGQACPVAGILRLGRSCSLDLTRNTWDPSVSKDSSVPKQRELGLAAVGLKELTLPHQGRTDVPHSARRSPTWRLRQSSPV